MVVDIRTDYNVWNLKIAQHFFNPEMAGRPVHLYATEAVITEIGEKKLGARFEDFIEAVRIGPRGVTREGLCQKALQARENWSNRSTGFPLYTGYLALFVLAAGEDGDFALNAYYPKLRALLGEENGGALPSFDKMWELWLDLEDWANKDRHGELGTFTARSVGGWIHVGYPIAQTVLTEHERKQLPRIFAEALLDPRAQPGDAELARQMRIHGKGKVLRRTFRLVEQPDRDRGLYQLLIETLREELRNWNGEVQEWDQEGESRSRKGYSSFSLRLCTRIRPLAKVASTTMRCSVNREFPEEDILLAGSGRGQPMSCRGDVEGWSTPLEYEDSGELVDAAMIDWCKGLELVDENLRWRFTLPGSEIRVFVSGEPEGLPDWIEVKKLEPGQRFFIAAHDTAWPRILKWAGECCVEAKEIVVTKGLPSGWHLLESKGAVRDTGLGEQLLSLSLANSVRISLRGGIRVAQGNEYYKFGLPSVALEGGNGTERLFCKDAELAVDSETRTCQLPDGLPVGERVTIEARTGENMRAQISLFVVDAFTWKYQKPGHLFDGFGAPTDEHDSPVGIAGAYTNGIAGDEHEGIYPPEIFGGERVYFVGQEPGQVVEWPAEKPPDGWRAVWAVTMKRDRGRAVFCGDSLGAVPGKPDVKLARRKLKDWKEVLWFMRKRIDPPDLPALHRLWDQYQKAARNAR